MKLIKKELSSGNLIARLGCFINRIKTNHDYSIHLYLELSTAHGSNYRRYYERHMFF